MCSSTSIKQHQIGYEQANIACSKHQKVFVCLLSVLLLNVSIGLTYPKKKKEKKHTKIACAICCMYFYIIICHTNTTHLLMFLFSQLAFYAPTIRFKCVTSFKCAKSEQTNKPTYHTQEKKREKCEKNTCHDSIIFNYTSHSRCTVL